MTFNYLQRWTLCNVNIICRRRDQQHFQMFKCETDVCCKWKYTFKTGCWISRGTNMAAIRKWIKALNRRGLVVWLWQTHQVYQYGTINRARSIISHQYASMSPNEAQYQQTPCGALQCLQVYILLHSRYILKNMNASPTSLIPSDYH